MKLLKPYLRWQGGKTRLLKTLREHYPIVKTDRWNYYEPFLGAGTIFLDILANGLMGYQGERVTPVKFVLGDAERPLIHTWRNLLNDAEPVLHGLRTLEDGYNECETVPERRRFYRAVRSHFNEITQTTNPLGPDVAAAFIFLNRLGFNGVYRVNNKGEYNVPGSGEDKKVVTSGLRKVIAALDAWPKPINFYAGDFANTTKEAIFGDFVYFDPPYYKNHSSYTAAGFGLYEHERLSEVFKTLTERDVFCMLSHNADSEVLKFYDGFNVSEVQTRRSGAPNGEARKQVPEIIVTNYVPQTSILIGKKAKWQHLAGF